MATIGITDQSSVFDEHEVGEVVPELIQELKDLYIADNVPWVIGYSGGKDSTAVTTLVWRAVADLAETDRNKPVYVITNDTLVENPVVSAWVSNSLQKMNHAAEEQKMPFSAKVLHPEIGNTFWVNLIGRGYPAPRPKFRWCTERLKIKPDRREHRVRQRALDRRRARRDAHVLQGRDGRGQRERLGERRSGRAHELRADLAVVRPVEMAKLSLRVHQGGGGRFSLVDDTQWTEGSIAYAKSFDWRRGQRLAVPGALTECLRPGGPLVTGGDLDEHSSGLLLLPEGPLLVAAHPILPSTSQGPSRGTLLMGRHLDAVEVGALAEQTHMDASRRILQILLACYESAENCGTLTKL